MARSAGRLLPELMFLMTLAGCVHPGDGCGGGPVVSPPPAGDCQMPPSERGRLEPALRGAAAIAAAGVPAGPADEPPPPYRVLPADQCLRLAAAASNLANLLDQERDALSRQSDAACLGPGPKRAELIALQQSILTQSALELRNESAGAALDLYVRLAEAEAKSEVVQASLTDIEGALARTRELRSKGLKSPVDYETLHRQQLDLLSDQGQLQLQIEQLNTELSRLLGVDLCSGAAHFWPAGPWDGPAGAIDCEAAVAEGLAFRPELVLLGVVSQELNAATLSAAGQLLRSINGLLGMAEHSPRCPALAKVAELVLHDSGGAEELETRRGQVEHYRAERARVVANEIRQDVRSSGRRARLVALARERARSWEERVQEVEDERARGIASFAEVTTAKLEWLRARGKVVEEWAGWQRALVKLKMDVGALVREAGLSPAALCNGGPAADGGSGAGIPAGTGLEDGPAPPGPAGDHWRWK